MLTSAVSYEGNNATRHVPKGAKHLLRFPDSGVELSQVLSVSHGPRAYLNPKP
jgi:hypothetical protein